MSTEASSYAVTKRKQRGWGITRDKKHTLGKKAPGSGVDGISKATVSVN